MTLSEHIDRYLASLVTTRSPQTILWYRKRLAPLRAIQKNISSIGLSDLQAVYAQLANQTTRWVNHPSGRAPEKGGLSPATLRGYVRAWRVFFNWLLDDGVLKISPARKLPLPRQPEQPPKAITASDRERLLEAARLSSARDYAIVCILADSACRVGGLCHITLDNLDLAQAQAIVIEKGQTRFLLFTPRTVQAIWAYLSERPAVIERALFIGRRGPLTPSGIHTLLDRLSDQAGIVGRHNPHSFRHAWARHALEQHAGLGDIAHVLGHRQIQTTYQFYGRWDTTELHAIHDRYTVFGPEEQIDYLRQSKQLDGVHETV